MGRLHCKAWACAALVFCAVAFAPTWSVFGQDGACARGDFVSVVDGAAAALQTLNDKNKSLFQDRLRALKAKNGWSQDAYLKNAEPFVRDAEIEAFDAESSRLLGEIAQLGQEGSEAATPDCAMLGQLRGKMDVLVTTQKKKWAYMFQKIDAALGP